MNCLPKQNSKSTLRTVQKKLVNNIETIFLVLNNIMNITNKKEKHINCKTS